MSEATARAERVQRLLDDPDLQRGLRDVRDALHQRFAQTPPSNVEQLVECRKYLHLLDSLETNLRQAIQDGKLEAFRENEEERRSRIGELWNRHRRA